MILDTPYSELQKSGKAPYLDPSRIGVPRYHISSRIIGSILPYQFDLFCAMFIG